MSSMQARHTADNMSVRQSEPKSCLEPISYIIGGRNPKFSVWIHLGVAECIHFL